eukprot:CAMPEP_0197263366 /NCGR_PEP_ID=MMETSP1432-20130617/1112_1 /TAXON_ID=44447 /ORGANISM="Pseudo-nitzschia delicatissima, Strain UNC1205" /LENGTH=75 /DNA_ID=CAMNT_0042727833 /DNA_START=400 /DNA_END=624 /DNA_ORIENTATION=-
MAFLWHFKQATPEVGKVSGLVIETGCNSDSDSDSAEGAGGISKWTVMMKMIYRTRKLFLWEDDRRKSFYSGMENG